MRIPDREKQRRDYLTKKAGTISKGIAGGIVCLILALVTLVLLILGIFCCFYRWADAKGETQYGLPVGIGFLIVAAITGSLAALSGLHAKDQADRAKALPYIPPLTPGTLPAEEVLIRGAQPPTEGQGALLLRAAEESVNTPAKELLRAAAEEPRKMN